MENQLKSLIATAVKENNITARDILRLVLGQFQTEGATKLLTDDRKVAIVRKLINSNEITLAAMAETQKKNWNQDWQENANKLLQEIKILNSLLPQTWTKEQLFSFLAFHSTAIKEAKAEGPALGLALKALKAEGASVNNAEVKEVVLQIRQG